MKIIRSIIFILSFLLLTWLFLGNFPEFDLARNKNSTFYQEQVDEINKTNSIPELKEIAISKVFETQRINTLKDEKSSNQLYLIFILIVFNIFLYFTKNKID